MNYSQTESKSNNKLNVNGNIQNNTNLFSLLLVIALSMMLLWSAWSKGLYFSDEYIIVNILMGTIFLLLNLTAFRNGLNKFNLLDSTVIFIGLTYTFSILYAINTSASIYESLKVWSYIVLYFIISRLSKDVVRIFLIGIVGVGALISIYGILTVPGWINDPSSWDRAQGILSSRLQYHNAFASFLFAPMILGAYLSFRSSSVLHGIALSSSLFIILIGIAGSQSRGAYLVFLAVIVAFLVIEKGSISRILALILNIFLSIIVWNLYNSGVNSGSIAMPIISLVLGVLLASILHIASIKLSQLRFRVNKGILAFALVGVLVLVVIGVALYGGTVYQRILSISLQDHNVEERFVMYWDALKMFLAQPIGYGGGSWESMYHAFQSYLYYSNETHSIIFKILVEVGIFGIIALCLITYEISREVVRDLRDKRNNEHLKYAILISILAIGSHSLIDFNLSLGAISLIFWGLLGAYRSFTLSGAEVAEGNDPRTKRGSSVEVIGFVYKVQKWILVAGGLYLIIASFVVLTSENLSQAAAQEFRKNNLSVALAKYEKAISWFPYDWAYWTDISQVKMDIGLAKKDKKIEQDALESIKHAVDLNSYEPKVQIVNALLLARSERYDEAYKTAKGMQDLSPYQTISYEQSAKYGIQYAISLIEKGDNNTSRQVLDDVLSIPGTMKARYDILEPVFKRNWITAEKLQSTSDLRLAIAQANVLIGKDSALKELMLLQKDNEVSTQATIWRAALEYRSTGKVTSSTEKLLSASEIKLAKSISELPLANKES